MDFFKKNLKKISISAGFIVFFAILFFTGAENKFINALSLGGLMVYFWILELIPIYITAFFPLIFAFPLGLLEVNGKIDSGILAKSYGNSMIFIFLGGFMLALALEKWEIHTQIAKRIIKIVGNSKGKIILGFLMSTALLSMWVSNTACALMMLPISTAMIKGLPLAQKNSKFSLYVLLSIAYGSSIGGVGTLLGSPPNLQMASILSKQYQIEIDFISWFKIGFPVCIVMIIATYIFIRLSMGKEAKESVDNFSLEYTPWTSNQLKVLSIFLLVVFLWSFKDLIAKTGLIYSDENAAILGGLLLFLVPADKTQNLLEWNDTKQIPWGILFLFGGGLALAEILTNGGVIVYMANSLHSLTALSFPILLLCLITIAIFATEILSNLALVTILIPIVAGFATAFHYPLVQLCVALTLASSFAFMLPIGTPPNAIVFSSGHVTIKQMVKAGFLLNIIGVLVVYLISTIIF
ncbi:MAG: SLC13/DASS family transporter [Flavobacteriia bacterium]|nr:SLC13/DASS family transporter [Flavobacteriia bacterium]